MTKTKTIYLVKSTGAYYTKAGTKVCTIDLMNKYKNGNDMYKISKKTYDKTTDLLKNKKK